MKCEDKDGVYSSRKEALKALHAHLRAARKWGNQQKGAGAKRVYRCEECYEWHLTSKKSRKTRKAKKKAKV